MFQNFKIGPYVLLYILSIILLQPRAMGYSKEAVYRARAHGMGFKGYQVWGTVDYFKTSKHWDEQGKSVTMDSGESYQKWEGDLQMRYGFAENMEVYLGLRYRSNTSRQLGATTTTGTTTSSVYHDAKKNGIESYLLGGQYSFDPSGSWLIGMYVQYRASTYNNDAYNYLDPYTNIVLGDGENNIELGVRFANKMSYRTLWSNSIGVNFPNRQLSQEIVWYSELAFITGNIGWIAGVRGIESLKTSDHSTTPSARTPLGTGATYLWNSVNRTITTPYIGANASFSEKVKAELRGYRTFRGNSTDMGTGVSLAIVYTGHGIEEKEIIISQYKDYEVEGAITKVSPRERFIKSDRGIAEDVYKGQKVDIYEGDYLGGHVLIGSGVVFEVRPKTSVIKIFRKYRNKNVREGMIVRFK
ncbi:MAG: hypothetical protein HOE90_01075 [Bacteriovoracaceae bacterium]|jgi:hypothetical protein|nr:hypothetical protein [Bacteriovoracaceae bacterium]